MDMQPLSPYSSNNIGYKYLTFVNTCDLPRRASCDPYECEYTRARVCVCVTHHHEYVTAKTANLVFFIDVHTTTIPFNLTPAEQLNDSTNCSSLEKISGRCCAPGFK
jgi:hypothetical protein